MTDIYIVDEPAHDVIVRQAYDEIRRVEAHYHDYNFVPLKLTMQGIELGQIEEGREMPKEQTGLKPTVYVSGLILGGMLLWSFSKGSGGQLSLPSLLGALK